MRYFSGFLLFLICCAPLQASSVEETRQRLAALDRKIHDLHGSLNTRQHRQKILKHEQNEIEKSIGEQVRQLSAVDKTLKNLSIDIEKREQNLLALQQQQARQQSHLARHLKARYQMDTLQPLKWFINRSQPEPLSRTLTYYQYLLASRKQLLTNMRETQEAVHKEQERLKHQYHETTSLQKSLQSRKAKLQASRNYQKQVTVRLQKEIDVSKKKLDNYQRDRSELSQLLQTLYRQSTQKNRQPFSQTRHTLPLPVDVRPLRKMNMNQGILFLAPEGQKVHAVFPGKVVFSDGLKGYGLLLILDHGQGYMTLYAHNLSLLRKNGETVLQGEPIATVGHSGGLRENGLYFEVRHRGKAVSAQEWLIKK